MRIAIASGKGGTGKTTVAVSMALALAEQGPVTLIDCDAEGPNCALFLELDDPANEPYKRPFPVIDKDKCTACGKCAKACRYNAIAALPTGAIVFGELCHSCGGCTLACPVSAITETDREVGSLSSGKAGNLTFHDGRLHVGEAAAAPVIEAVMAKAEGDDLVIQDCPPGTACSMVAAVKGADFAILVTEPTPFGLNDLKLAVEVVRDLSIPFGVFINRADKGDSRVRDYCSAESIPVLMELGFTMALAKAGSRGRPAIEADPDLADRLRGLAHSLTEAS